MKKNARKCSQNLLKSKILCNFVPQFRNCIKIGIAKAQQFYIPRRVYGGDFENTAGDIWLLRYDHVEKLFE